MNFKTRRPNPVVINMEIIRKSVSESILSLLNILPLIYISIAIILARVSVSQRKSGPV